MITAKYKPKKTRIGLAIVLQTEERWDVVEMGHQYR